MMKNYSVLLFLGISFFFLKNVNAQSNSRNWVNIQQQMVGAQPSMTSAAFSAFNSVSPFKYYSLAVATEVTTTAWSVSLEGSNDQMYWGTIVSNNSGAHPGGGIEFQSSAQPALYLRVRATTLGSGQKITATAVGVP
jgi:hypothetical protein